MPEIDEIDEIDEFLGWWFGNLNITSEAGADWARNFRANLLAAGFKISPSTSVLLEKSQEEVPEGKVR